MQSENIYQQKETEVRKQHKDEQKNQGNVEVSHFGNKATRKNTRDKRSSKKKVRNK